VTVLRLVWRGVIGRLNEPPDTPAALGAIVALRHLACFIYLVTIGRDAGALAHSGRARRLADVFRPVPVPQINVARMSRGRPMNSATSSLPMCCWRLIVPPCRSRLVASLFRNRDHVLARYGRRRGWLGPSR